jgi:CheY-like chemotaxis protein
MAAPAILIIEDEDAVARNLKSRLEGSGYRVQAIVSSGREALRRIPQDNPDLILIDISLPGDMDGIDIANVMRGRWSIPIVYLTGSTDDETLTRAKLSKPYGYVVKPYSQAQLKATIELALYRHQCDTEATAKPSSFASVLEQQLLGTARPEGDSNITCAMGEGTVEFDPNHVGPEPMSARLEQLAAVLEPAGKPGYLCSLDHYQIMRVAGQGSGGVVLQAFDDALHRVVAIKVLAPEHAGNPNCRLRFLREARAMAAVRNDYVIDVYAVDEIHGIPYLVMEFIAGVSVAQKLEGGVPLDIDEVLRIGYQTASGLAAAHAQGLVHRDIKPTNILLECGKDRVKITDFGLARAADDATLTLHGTVSGTPQFMAPEQAGARPLDHRCDLFSLGSVLYAMCTGRAPFQGETNMAVLKHVCEDQPERIRDLNPITPQWLVCVIERLLSKEPDSRFQTAAEVADILCQGQWQV